MVIDWTPTTGFTPCQVQPGPTHGPQPPLHIEKDLMPNMWQLIFANVPANGWIIHSYEYSCFCSYSEVV